LASRSLAQFSTCLYSVRWRVTAVQCQWKWYVDLYQSKAYCDFLLVFQCNYMPSIVTVPILYRFRVTPKKSTVLPFYSRSFEAMGIDVGYIVSWSQKTSVPPCLPHDHTASSFDALPACDGRTDTPPLQMSQNS